MANVDRVMVVLPEPMAAQIREAVEAGEFATAGDAVRDAVRLWSARRQAEQHGRDRLRQAWDAGKASGIHGEIVFDQLRREARRRLNARKADMSDAD